MGVAEGVDWSDTGWDSWRDLGWVRAKLDAGANPNAELYGGGSPLYAAAESGSPEVVAELARRVDDVDAEHDGRTALWAAVFENRPDNASVLAAAGADPWRPMMNGWSPGRLALAGPTPDLFPLPPGEAGLSEAEDQLAGRARSLIATLADLAGDGHSITCVANISAAEAVQRLGATPADEEVVEELLEDPWSDTDESDTIVGLTDVPGGCVVSQPWGYAAQMPGLQKLLSVGSVCYGLYANPKSGNQGSAARDGVIVEWDTHPGGGEVESDDPAEEILLSYLYQHHPESECCAQAGLQLPDSRAIIGTPDLWVALPARDYWS